VLQPACDLGLGDEPLTADLVVGVLLQELFQRHLAVQLAIQRHEDVAQPAPRMGSQDAEPLAVAGRGAHRQPGGAVGVIIVGLGGLAVLAPRDAGERGIDVGLAERGQAGAGGPARRHCGQTLLHIATVRF